MATSLLRPHAVAAGLGGRNAPIDKKQSFGAKKLVTKKIRESSMKFRHGVRVTVAAASTEDDAHTDIACRVASRVTTTIATAASTTVLAAAYPALADAVNTSPYFVVDDASTTIFESLMLGSDNLMHGALGVAALSTTYSLASNQGSMSPVSNTASVELKKERKTTTTLRQQFETERDAAAKLRSQLAEREANAAEIKLMLEATDEEKERLSTELADTKRKLADVLSKLTGLEAADEKTESEKRKHLSKELADTKRKLADAQSKLAAPAPAPFPSGDETSYPAKSSKKGNRKKGAAGRSKADAALTEKLKTAAKEEKRLMEDVTRLEKSLAQQDTLTANLEKVAEETKVYAADLKKQLKAAIAATAAAEKEKGKLTIALVATKQTLADVKAELASQEQMVVEVGAAVEAGRKREIEMMRLLQEAAMAEAALEGDLTATKQNLSNVQETLATMQKTVKEDPTMTEVEAKAKEEAEALQKAEATEEERRLVTDVIRLEEALAQQNTFMTRQGKIMQASQAEAASLKKQLQAASQEKMKLKQSLETTQQILADVKVTLKAQKKAVKEARSVDASPNDAELSEARLQEAEELKRRLAATEEEKMQLAAEVERQLREAAEEKSQLTASLEATQKNLEEVEAALATQERLMISVGKAAKARKTREEEMTLLLKNATEEKIRLAADTAHLEASLSQQTSIATNLGKMVAGSEAAAADLKKQMGATVLKGERSSELVTELEAQLGEQIARVEELQAQLAEVEAAGAGEGDKRKDELTRTQQLADQLNATQRTAAELSKELEKTQGAAEESMAQRQLVKLQLKTAEEKVAKVLAAKEQSELSFELAVRDKSGKISVLNGEIDDLKSTVEELKDQLAEVESKLELEKAGSLAAAKKNALAMLESFDVSQMMQSAEDGASMAEAMAAAGAIVGSAGAVEAAGAVEGEWLQAYDSSREINYWYNNITMEVVWELPEGAQVHQSVSSSHGPNDLPKHFEGPSGLNSR